MLNWPLNIGVYFSCDAAKTTCTSNIFCEECNEEECNEEGSAQCSH